MNWSDSSPRSWTNEQREQLLSLPPNEMQTRLERLYYATELGYGNAAEWWSEFRDSGGWPPNRPGAGRPDFRPDGPPRERGRRDGPPEFFDRDRMPRGPGGPGGPPRPRETRIFATAAARFGPPPDGPPPGRSRPGSTPDGPPPRDGERAAGRNLNGRLATAAYGVR